MAGLDINLDDRRFEDIVADIRRRIPGYTPEWTDLNDSDPGIAIVQVFAWLAETVLWRVNRVPDKSTLRFLRFVGVTPDAAVPARAWLTFTLSEGLTRPQMIRGGTIVSAGRDAEGRPILCETARWSAAGCRSSCPMKESVSSLSSRCRIQPPTATTSASEISLVLP